MDCALAGDFSSVIFYMTEHGYFQPKPENKEENQKQVIHLHEDIQDFLHNFLKDPPARLDNLKKKNNRELPKFARKREFLRTMGGLFFLLLRLYCSFCAAVGACC